MGEHALPMCFQAPAVCEEYRRTHRHPRAHLHQPKLKLLQVEECALSSPPSAEEAAARDEAQGRLSIIGSRS